MGTRPGRREGSHPLKSLGQRRGPRPRTQRFLPHKQLDQWPDPAIYEKLVAACMALPDVHGQQSRMAGDDTRALCLRDEVALGPPEAFIDDHEFCHLHALPEGNLHLTLPAELRQHVIELSWGEEHPGAEAGLLPETLTMIYAPRNDEELTAVQAVVSASYGFARGAA